MNQDFGSIFSTLLPGTSAALDPQEGESFLAGRRGAHWLWGKFLDVK